MTDPVSTALIVAGGTGVSIVLGMIRDHRKAEASRAREHALAERLQRQHEWDIADRANHTQVVLGAIHEGTQMASSAFDAGSKAIEVGNHVNEKLLEMGESLKRALPRSDTILANMLKQDSAVTPADLAHVLVELRINFNTLEKYAHDSIHRINNILAGMPGAAESIEEMEEERERGQ